MIPVERPQHVSHLCSVGPLEIMLFVVLALVGCRDQHLGTDTAADLREKAGAESQLVPDWKNHAPDCGIEFTYRNGEEQEINSILESVGGGAGLIDIDSDGRLDVILPGGGMFTEEEAIVPNETGVFRNRGEWKFTDVSQPSKLTQAPVYSHGIAAADIDNDGFTDILVTGYDDLALYVNNGDGTFRETAGQLGIVDKSWSSSAGWGDINADGLVDLYVTHYVDWSWDKHPACYGTNGVHDVCSPRSFEGLDDSLFLSNGGGFVDASRDAGLVPAGKGLGVVLADVDGDADVDIYVANDSTENFFYINEGGSFSECGLVQGVAVDDRAHPDGSMGVDIGDYDLDGRTDIWVANYESEAFGLYRNSGNSGFVYATPEAGIADVGDLFVGFGTAFVDIDLDGVEDLVVSNGHVVQTARQSPIRQQPLQLLNRDGHFERSVFDSGYFAESHIGRGLAVGDLDGDGDGDLVISHNNSPVAILENTLSVPERSITIKLAGRRMNRDGIGASVELETNERIMRRLVSGGGSYLSQSSYDVSFSVRKAERPIRITVTWQSRDASVVNIDADSRHLLIREPKLGEDRQPHFKLVP